MTTPTVEAESLLAIDLGSIHTKVLLFDIVDGQYHFIAKGIASSTVDAPFNNVGEGIRRALEHLEKLTGRSLLDAGSQLIVPEQSDGSGIDRLVVTYSTGPALRVVIASLLEDVSLESTQRLVNMTYGKLVEKIGLNDQRSTEKKLDAILQAKPNLIILTGGTDDGASGSIFKLVNLIMLVFRMLTPDERPELIYAGNRTLGNKIKEIFGNWTQVHIAPNIRPSIDLEDLDPAEGVLSQVENQIQYRRIGGLKELRNVCSMPPVSVPHAFGRIIRFLSQVYDPIKGVLGVDIGANAVIIAAALAGDLTLNVYPYGMGRNIPRILNKGSLEELTRWLPMDISESVIRDYIWHKSLYPANIPMTEETLAIEQAVARQILQLTMREALASNPGLGTSFEPILASGKIICQAPSPHQSMLMLLDGLQPIGVTTIILDQNGLTPSLGAAASVKAVLPVQVLESGGFQNLGTVICPMSKARVGTPILRIRLEYEDGNSTRLEIRQGALISLPLEQGQVVRIQLDALRNTRIGPHSKHGSVSFKTIGGDCGAVVDARGRPLKLPRDISKRREMMKRWQFELGG